MGSHISSGRLDSLQFLRFFAAFIVIFAHAELYEFRELNIPGNMLGLGAYGVDIFFVISGFIMVHATRSLGLGPRASLLFFLKRLARVMPLYLIFTVITVVLAFLYFRYPFEHNASVDLYYGAAKRDWSYILQSMTFTNWDIAPVFTIGWTLQFEFWFYVLFAISILIRVNVYAFFLVYVISIFGMDYIGYVRTGAIATIFSPLMFEFVLGIALYPILGLTKRLHGNAYFMSFLLLSAAFLLLCDFDPAWSRWLNGHYDDQRLLAALPSSLCYFSCSWKGSSSPRDSSFLWGMRATASILGTGFL